MAGKNPIKNSLNVPKESSEAVHRRRENRTPKRYNTTTDLQNTIQKVKD